MDLKTISATLAILGTGLTLSACKKAPAEGTEVPSDKAGGAEASCGAEKGHGHANCSGDKAGAEGAEKPEGSCGGDKAGGEKSCGGEKGCGGDKAEKPPEAAAADPAAATPSGATPTATATAADANAAKPTETTTKTKPKAKKGSKPKSGEMSCGEGTCA